MLVKNPIAKVKKCVVPSFDCYQTLCPLEGSRRLHFLPGMSTPNQLDSEEEQQQGQRRQDEEEDESDHLQYQHQHHHYQDEHGHARFHVPFYPQRQTIPLSDLLWRGGRTAIRRRSEEGPLRRATSRTYSRTRALTTGQAPDQRTTTTTTNTMSTSSSSASSSADSINRFSTSPSTLPNRSLPTTSHHYEEVEAPPPSLDFLALMQAEREPRCVAAGRSLD